MKKRIVYILLFIILLSSTTVFSESLDRNLVIVIEELSFNDIEKLDINEYMVGLVNIKTRKPYNDKSYYLSLSQGKKTNRKEKNISLADIAGKDNIAYISNKNKNIRYMLGDHAKYIGKLENINKLDKYSKYNSLLAVYLDNDEKNMIKEIIKSNSFQNIYILSRNISSENNIYVNRFLLPIVKIDNKNSGVLTSRSTRREGFVAIEDFLADFAESNGAYNEKNFIGKPFNSVDFKEDPLKVIDKIYKKNTNLLIVAYLCHGFFYLSVALMFLGQYYKSIRKKAKVIFLVAMNNIISSLVLSLFNLNNIYIYIILLFTMSLILYELSIYNKKLLNFYIIFLYVLLTFGNIFEKSIIYNSYIGFNNLFYGARFYGLNNGVAAVLLASNILTIDIIEKSMINKKVKTILIIFIPLLTSLNLSTKYGVNTGAFISSLVSLFTVYYYYLLDSKFSINFLVLSIIIALLLFTLNIYLDYKAGDGTHATLIISRTIDNGLGELYDMAKFKLKELIKLTIMPPFSIVIFFQILYIKNNVFSYNKLIKTLILVSLFGYIINDTGNILLIYMLSYLMFNISYVDKQYIF